MKHLLLLLLLLFVAACPKPVLVRDDSCLRDPPPEMFDVAFSGADAGCPAPFLRCITADEAGKLYMNIQNLRHYAEEAYQRCYVTEDGGVTTSPQ